MIWRARPTSRCTSASLRPAWARRASSGRRRRWAILLNEGIGDTIRVSLTPRPGGDRRDEVYAACEILQALGLRSFSPSVTACPGCGRTTSSTFQELAERTQDYIRERLPEWKTQYEGVETLTLAVMGCVVNGPGESKAANIGISLPGTGEAPNCPVYIDGEHVTTLRGTYEELAQGFRALIDNYVATKYPPKGSAHGPATLPGAHSAAAASVFAGPLGAQAPVADLTAMSMAERPLRSGGVRCRR